MLVKEENLMFYDYKLGKIRFSIKKCERKYMSVGETYMNLTNIIFNSVANYTGLKLIEEIRQGHSILATIKIYSKKNHYADFIELVSNNCWLEQPIYEVK